MNEKLAPCLKIAYEKFAFQEEIVIVNFAYLMEQEDLDSYKTNPSRKTHVICIMLQKKYGTDGNRSTVQIAGLDNFLENMVDSHLSRIFKNSRIHILLSWPDSQVLSKGFLRLAEAESCGRYCNQLRAQEIITKEDTLRYLLSSQALVDYKSRHNDARRIIYPGFVESNAPGTVMPLLRSIVSQFENSQRKARLLVIVCCSNRRTNEFLKYLKLDEECQFRLQEPSDCSLQTRKKPKVKRIFVEKDCIVSGISRNYIFFRRIADDMPFSLSRSNFTPRMVFGRGELLSSGDYIGDGKDSFLEAADIDFESVPLTIGGITFDIKPVGSDILKDVHDKGQEKLQVVLLTESGEERWTRFAENCRLSIPDSLKQKGLDVNIVELNCVESTNIDTDEPFGVEILIHGEDCLEKSIYGVEYKKPESIRKPISAIEKMIEFLNDREKQ